MRESQSIMDGLFKNKYRIKSIRLKHWDYSSCGGYFINICTKNREHFFGAVVNGKMELSVMGGIISYEWLKTEQIRKNISLDKWVIMPNHFHGIIFINDCNKTHRRDVARNVSTKYMSYISPKSNSLSVIIRSFKSAVTNQCHKIGFTHFAWQPGFYEHIIRDDADLNRIREYIMNNPREWEFDHENSFIL